MAPRVWPGMIAPVHTSHIAAMMILRPRADICREFKVTK
jgi:hypothetical protein